MTFMRDSQSVSRVLASLSWTEMSSHKWLSMSTTSAMLKNQAAYIGLLAVKSTTIIVDSGKSTQRCLQFVSDDQLREIEDVWVDDVRYSQPSIQRRIADFIVSRGRHGLKPG